jgi:hypothetical protein
VQRLAEEVLHAAGSPSPGLDARLLAAAIDGLRLEQLTLPRGADGIAVRVESARPVVERLLRLLTGTGG